MSRIFCKFVGKESLYNGLIIKMFNNNKRLDYGNIHVLLHVVLCHLPHHLHGYRFCLEGGGEVVGIPASCSSLKKSHRMIVAMTLVMVMVSSVCYFRMKYSMALCTRM